MILTKKSHLFAFTAAASVFFLLLAAYAYSIIIQSGNFNQYELKLYAEKVLFAGIIGAMIFAVIGIWISARSFLFSKSLDKVLILNRSGSYSSDAALRKLGKIGNQLADVISELNSLGEKRALRISALDRLCRFFINSNETMCAVVNVKGEIQYSSSKLAEKFSREPEELKGRFIDDLTGCGDLGAEIQGVVALRKEMPSSDGKAIIYPVMNSANEVSYLVYIFEKIKEGSEKLNNVKEKAAAVTESNKKIMGRIYSFFQKKKIRKQ